MTLITVSTAPADQTPRPLGTVLVDWLRKQGREDEAVHVAHRLRLISDDDLERSWLAGTDVLAGLVAS